MSAQNELVWLPRPHRFRRACLPLLGLAPMPVTHGFLPCRSRGQTRARRTAHPWFHAGSPGPHRGIAHTHTHIAACNAGGSDMCCGGCSASGTTSPLCPELIAFPQSLGFFHLFWRTLCPCSNDRSRRPLRASLCLGFFARGPFRLWGAHQDHPKTALGRHPTSSCWLDGLAASAGIHIIKCFRAGGSSLRRDRGRPVGSSGAQKTPAVRIGIGRESVQCTPGISAR